MIFVTIFVIKFFISFDILSFFWVWRSSSFWRWRQLGSYISYYLSYYWIWPFEAFLSVAHQWLAPFEDGASWGASQAAAASENRLLTEFWRRRICTSRQGLVSTWAANKSTWVVFSHADLSVTKCSVLNKAVGVGVETWNLLHGEESQSQGKV